MSEPLELKPFTSDDHQSKKTSGSTSETKESQPLLPNRNGILKRLFPTGFKEEFKVSLKMIIPVVLTEMTASYFQPIATMFAGRLSKQELAAVALSNSLINVMGVTLISGLSTAADTLLSQAYGMGKNKMIGIFLQRNIIIATFVFMVTISLQLNIERILAGAGQDPGVSKLVGRYLTIFIPGMASNFLWTLMKKYTQCQNVVLPHIYFGLVAHIAHVILQYIFVIVLNMGIDGSAIAQALAYILLLSMTLIYISCSKFHKATWPGWTRYCLRGWVQVAYLGFFGIVMVALEFWGVEACTIVSGYISIEMQASQAVIFQLDTMFISILTGFSVVASIRTGQFLGAGKPKEAFNSSTVLLVVAVAWTIVAAIIIICLRYQVAALFTTDKDVINLVANIFPVVALYQIADGICSIGRGTLRGCGKQRLGAILTFIAFYVPALPVGLALMLATDIGPIGFWLSTGFATAVMAIIMTYVLYWRFDWEQICQAIRDNHEKEKVEKPNEINYLPTETVDSKDLVISSVDDSLESDILPTKVLLNKFLVSMLFLAILVLAILLRVFLPELPLQSTHNGIANSTVLVQDSQLGFTTSWVGNGMNISGVV